MDFWKFAVLKKGKYIPKNFLTKKRLVFKMKQILHSVTEGKPLYYFYLGSQTTPPCEEYAYHLVIGKPIKIANCQLKVLRENSLATTEVKQVHSRLIKVNNPDEYDEKDDDGADGADGSGGDDGSAGLEGLGGLDGGDGMGGSGRGSGGVFAIRSMSYDANLYRFVPKNLRHLMLKSMLGGKDQFGDGDDSGDDNDLNC